MSLARAEQYLRRDDRAIRLRPSLEGPNVLVERKTFRGRVGSVSPQLGREWSLDGGIRRELGHVLVATIHREAFDVRVLRESLLAADTWRRSTPYWKQVEEQDATEKVQKVRNRKDGIRYKTENLWNNYAWRSKARVNVPVKIA